MSAGHVLEDGTEALYPKQQVAAQPVIVAGCGEPGRLGQPTSADGTRAVNFEWEPRTSELIFDAAEATAGIPLPEPFVTAASLHPSQGCE
jgi:hypothetical protein